MKAPVQSWWCGDKICGRMIMIGVDLCSCASFSEKDLDRHMEQIQEQVWAMLEGLA